MVARQGEFRQWRHVSRSGSVVLGYSGQGDEKEGMILTSPVLLEAYLAYDIIDKQPQVRNIVIQFVIGD